MGQIFNNGSNKMCGRQPLKIFTWSIFKYFASYNLMLTYSTSGCRMSVFYSSIFFNIEDEGKGILAAVPLFFSTTVHPNFGFWPFSPISLISCHPMRVNWQNICQNLLVPWKTYRYEMTFWGFQTFKWWNHNLNESCSSKDFILIPCISPCLHIP